MANGDEAIAAWQVQDGTDRPVGDHDRKMSSFESMNRHQGFVLNQTTTTTTLLSDNSSIGMGVLSIVNPDADRPLPANNLPSSENIGRLLTAEFSTDVTQTQNGTRVDINNAFASSFTSSFTRQHHHSSQHDGEQLQSHQQPFDDNNNNNINTTNYSTFYNTNSNIETYSASDNHLEPPTNLTTSTNTEEGYSNTLSPSGNREADWGGARLSSGNTSSSNHSQEAPGLYSQDLSLSSTPQQSNLSTINSAYNTNNISIINIPPTAGTIPAQHHLHTSITDNIRGLLSDQVLAIMGHSNVTGSSWALDEDDDSKMDRNTPEGKSRDGDDSTVQSTAILSTGTHDDDGDDHDHLSPASSPRVVPTAGPSHDTEDAANAIIGTPSTVSTAPSTEDASLGTESLEKIGLKLDPTYIEPFSLHRRAPSWDRSPVQRQLYNDTEFSASATPHPATQQRSHPAADSTQYWLPQQHQAPSPAQAFAHHQHQPHQQPHPTTSPWGTPHATQPRIASFRSEENIKHDSRVPTGYTFARVPQQPQQQHGHIQAGTDNRWLQSPRPFAVGSDGHMQYPGQQARVGVQHLQQQQQQEGMGPHAYRSTQGYNPYQVPRKPGYPPQHPLPPSQSPQRPTRGDPRSKGPSPHRPQPQQGGGGPTNAGPPSGGSSSRSSSEILKTLLRKKACLYEPDTSRAVALVTWLVGRELALEHGYFSRQQLQAGVHACVAEKIESGTITRTKVNRCMQIILNSCFHYIIPRPDGTEENGDTFRAAFQKEVSNDSRLLRLLPAPWNDLVVKRDVVLQASDAEQEGGKHTEQHSNQSSPKGSPTLKPVEGRSPNRDHGVDGDIDSKRAVLLCFNENVRAAEDVFRCHNEFIRDSAHSSNLQLTAQEWRIFFGKEAASAPYIWGNVGIPVVAVESIGGASRKVDVLGQMTPAEAGKFRTTWCAKRYDHDHEFCGMAHVEVNGGWLRRDPNLYSYKDEFCPCVVKIPDKRGSPNHYVINECPKGILCEFAHSHEEMIYHPNRYKSKICGSVMRTGACRFGDICPNLHPSDSARPTGKKGDGRPPNVRHGRSSAQSGPSGKNAATIPTNSPILYAGPAPVSSFERHLLMPGLQNLYRRQCNVVRAYLRNPKCRCCYSHFGDESGIGNEPSAPRPATRPGLPSSLRM